MESEAAVENKAGRGAAAAMTLRRDERDGAAATTEVRRGDGAEEVREEGAEERAPRRATRASRLIILIWARGVGGKLESGL